MTNIHTPILLEQGANYPELVDAFGNIFAELHTTSGAEIVTAVNSHQELLDALKALVNAPTDNPDHYLRAQQDALRAIDKAEKE